MKVAAGEVRLESLAKHYVTGAGQVRALDGVSFAVEPGSSVAIVGPSGCGKSTMLGLIGGLEAPTAGRVVVGGIEVSSLDESGREHLRRYEIGFVYQSDNLLPFLSAVENVALVLSIQGAADGYDRCYDLLGRLGLAAVADNVPDQLSRGQRQRVAVARALVHQPALVLADEPTGSLDAHGSATIVELLLAVQQEAGTTLIVVTHDPLVAAQMDTTRRLHDGRLADDA